MTARPPAIPQLDRSAVASSRLRGRVVLVFDGTVDQTHGRLLLDALASLPAVSCTASIGVFEHGLPRAFGNHQLSQDAGLGLLAPLDVLTAAARTLVDDLLGVRAAEAGLVVDLVRDDPVHRTLASALFPDATVVGLGDQPTAPAALRLAPADVARSPEGAAADVVAAASAAGAGAEAPVVSTAPDRADLLRDRLMIVFGVPRSGTTWLEELLLAHPSATGLPAGESWLFRAVQGLWQNHEGGHGLHEVVDRAQLARAIRRFCDHLLVYRMRQDPGATHFVEKTPANAWLLPWIRAVYPDGWYVHLVRDGRDVSRSAAEMAHGTGDVREAAAHWAATLQEVDARRWILGRFREVRYEELLLDPAAGAASVLDWAGLSVDEDTLAAIRSAAGVRVSRHGTTGPVGAGKWNRMDPPERRIVLATAGEQLVARGYASADDVADARRALRRPSGLVAEVRRRFRLRPPVISRPRSPGSSR